MVLRIASAALFGLLFLAQPALADPVGTYSVKGVRGGGTSGYSGTVEVKRIEEKYEIVWSVDGKQARGIALGGAFYQGAFMIGPAHPDDLMLAIGYTDGTIFGTATMFLQQNGSYEGYRLFSNGSKAGQEVWTPVK